MLRGRRRGSLSLGASSLVGARAACVEQQTADGRWSVLLWPFILHLCCFLSSSRLRWSCALPCVLRGCAAVSQLSRRLFAFVKRSRHCLVSLSSIFCSPAQEEA